MKNLSVYFLMCLVLTGLTASALGQSNADQIDKLQSQFEKDVEALNKPPAILSKKYHQYLETQKAAYQKDGNLKGMLAVVEESKTFESSSSSEFSPFPELKRLQGIYRSQRSALDEKRNGLLLKLIQSYRKTVEDLASEWTKAGNIESAKLALAASERYVAMEKNPKLAKVRKPKAILVSGGGTSAGEEMVSALGVKLCWIPAGKFIMGSRESERSRVPKHEKQVNVELTNGFWIGKYEVTQEEYENVIGTNPSQHKGAGKMFPVESVSWDEAVAFCVKLTEQEYNTGKLPRTWTYSLPTEAQWEYACRAGTTGAYSGGKSIDEVGWYGGNSDRKTHQVGLKKSNPWGLHDMHGNVREWCLDWFTFKLPGGKDPVWEKGDKRSYRGGSCIGVPKACRSADRFGKDPKHRSDERGFRVVLIPAPIK